MRKNDFSEAEVFGEKVKITSEKNQNFIFEKIKNLSQGKLEIIGNSEKDKFDSPPPVDFIKKERFFNKKLIVPSNSVFNWTSKNFVPYKVKYLNNNDN